MVGIWYPRVLLKITDSTFPEKYCLPGSENLQNGYIHYVRVVSIAVLQHCYFLYVLFTLRV